MARVAYTAEFDPMITARGMAVEVEVSPKHAREIAHTIKGMSIDRARSFLEEVIALKTAVPMKRFKKGVAHRRGGVGPGRYPQKCAREFLKLLKNVEANAEYKGLDVRRMRIVHACTKEGRTIEAIFPRARGRVTPKRRETVNIELVIQEV
ncbi:MAG: 50S ribosomal protein L22 [Methermicoccaceae archaeon]